MIRVITFLLVFVLASSLLACSQGPVSPSVTETFTPYIGGTETAFAAEQASPTPWIAGTETALAALTPTPWIAGTETALAIASQTHTPPALPTLPPPTFGPTTQPLTFAAGTFTPVFYGSNSFLLLGGYSQDQGWISAENAFAYVNGAAEYDFYGPRGSLKLRGSALEFSPICVQHFMPSPVVLPESMVGVASGWVTQKTETRELSSDDASYKQAVSEWFESREASPTEIRITRILQTDLEGDGVDEVLISAAYFKDASGHMTETGDYSVVLMRKVQGNEVLTVPLISEYYVSGAPELSYPQTYTLAEAIDLNQDGTLEVVVDVSRWEGRGAIVFRVDGQNVREVLRAIC